MLIIVLALTLSLFIFRDTLSIVEMVIVALTNTLVLVTTKYFDVKDKEASKNNTDDNN